MKTVRPIRNETDYDAALGRIERLMDAAPGSAEGDLLDVLVTLVEAYEEKRWRIEPPDPIDAIKMRLEQRGLTRKHLEKLLGSRGRVSEILGRKRALSLEMIRRLHRDLGIPAESLIQPTTRGRRSSRKRSAA
ncbi:helix-turn-helix domain-containing protein [Candidatus Binatia bacterium]|jgi:HTH-type transcriptional regulator/antitoxin HigA|nr:helix-turn-helix domain-containing protein [Candidatus Binatia bacterium]